MKMKNENELPKKFTSEEKYSTDPKNTHPIIKEWEKLKDAEKSFEEFILVTWKKIKNSFPVNKHPQGDKEAVNEVKKSTNRTWKNFKDFEEGIRAKIIEEWDKIKGDKKSIVNKKEMKTYEEIIKELNARSKEKEKRFEDAVREAILNNSEAIPIKPVKKSPEIIPVSGNIFLKEATGIENVLPLFKIEYIPEKEKVVPEKEKVIPERGQPAIKKSTTAILESKFVPKKIPKIEEEPLPKPQEEVRDKVDGKVDVSKVAKEIMEEQIKLQRGPVKKTLEGTIIKSKKTSEKYVKTGIIGFDALLTDGIPEKSTVLVAGGAGCGKTIFCLQIIKNKIEEGKKCLYMSFEEKEEKLIRHMEGFGWDAKGMIKTGNLKIQRANPFDITRNVDALLAKQKGELLIDVDPVIIPRDFKPDFIFLDSLTAIASAFTGKEESYRIYIEQLFRFFEKIGATSFLITETEQIPKIFSKTGVEEFLADGVIVMYNLKQRNIRENAIEILKLRGAGHKKKIVALQITSEGIVIYPEQEVFSEME